MVLHYWDSPPPPAPVAEYFSGLDLGQAKDPSALAVLERTIPPGMEGQPGVAQYAVRHLQRFPLGTSYLEVVEATKKLFEQAPLTNTTLAIDATGVGRAVTEMVRRSGIAAKIRPITITAGSGSAGDVGGGFRVAKVELVGVLQMLLQGQRIKVAPSLAEAKTLVRELQNFRVKITAAAAEIFEAWRENMHDDLVLAVACAAWLGERGRRANVY